MAISTAKICTQRVAIITTIVITIVCVIIIAVAVSKRAPSPEPPADRIECPGFKSQSECVQHGCRYEEVSYGPRCFMARTDFGYEISNSSVDGHEQVGEAIKLRSKQKNTPYGDSLPNVMFHVTHITENILRIKIFDSDQSRYEVPVQKTFPLLSSLRTVRKESLAYQVITSTESGFFAFKVQRTSDKTILFDSSIGGLVLSDQFLQVVGYLPSNNVYGLGENVHPTFRHDMKYKTWPLFARDRLITQGQANHYGVHPFYTCLENNTKSHGVLLLNSNAMDVTLLPAPAISFRTVGGILDLFFFVGEDPEHVVRLYTSLIGRPQLPPYWSLGFQISRYGYENLDNVKKVVERTRAAAIPQEVQFLDIDHMHENLDFTFDSVNFGGLPDYINKTKSEYRLKWIIIVDPAIANVPKYSPFESGLAKNIYIKRAPQWDAAMFPELGKNDNVTYGRVWPGEIVGFPDFFLEDTKIWWRDNIITHHKQIQFDGLWIDMNEPSNFGTNEDKPFYCIKDEPCWSLHCPKSTLEDPPYNPVNIDQDRLSAKTLCMESIQGTDSDPFLHYNVHSLYGWSQTEPTLEAAEMATKRRSLVISRSTYPSSGRHAGHWLGDNKSSYQDMQSSVIGIMEFNLFGIPYIGADVCGFFLDASEELCARWMQLGAFYPFYRNHNGMNQKDQDPGSLSGWAKEASRRAVLRRYHLRSHLYTLFYRAHVDGATVVRPLHHEFPSDKNTWDTNVQFMWGGHLLITPVLTEGSKTVSVYLPKGEWWLFQYEKSRMESTSEASVIASADHDDDIPLHVRGGFILPIDSYEFGNNNENAGRNLSLYIFPDKTDAAVGEVFVDDGFSTSTIEQNLYVLYQFTYKNCVLLLKPNNGSKFVDPEPRMHQIYVFRSGDVTNVDAGPSVQPTFSVDQQTKVLTITINQKIKDAPKIMWSDSEKKCQTV